MTTRLYRSHRRQDAKWHRAGDALALSDCGLVYGFNEFATLDDIHVNDRCSHCERIARDREDIARPRHRLNRVPISTGRRGAATTKEE